ncbi:MAG: hypothetical protein MUF85_01490 [Patescibacteria group bacterium]|nr:hypothetical protein [Patescibacteria group bacterium]
MRLEGRRGLADLWWARNYIFENKFSRVGFLAECHWKSSPRTPFGVSRIKSQQDLTKTKPPNKDGSIFGGPAGT